MRPDYIKDVGMDAIGKADFDVECYVFAIACWNFRKNEYERMVALVMTGWATGKLNKCHVMEVDLQNGREDAENRVT